MWPLEFTFLVWYTKLHDLLKTLTSGAKIKCHAYVWISGLHFTVFKVRSFEMIWIRISDPRSRGSLWIKWTDESTLNKDSPVHLIYHDQDHSKGTHPLALTSFRKLLWVFFHAKPKSDREFRIRINDPSDPWRLLVCILLSFIVCIEGWCVGWVESVSARVLYENGHSQESLVPLVSTSFPWCPVVVATSTPSRIGHMLFSRGFALYLFIKLCEQMHVKSE